MRKRNRFFGSLVVFLVLSILTVNASATILTSVKLAWCPNNDPAVLGYKLYRGTESGVYGPPVDVGNVTMIDLADIGMEFEEGINQYFAVTAYGDNIESAFSTELVVNVVEGNGAHDNWTKVRGSALIDGLDGVEEVLFGTSGTATSASQNKTSLTGLDLKNTQMYVEVLAAGTGSYLPYISIILSVLLPDNSTVNATMQYKYIDPELNSHTATIATFGLGLFNDGQWHTFNRDLVIDLVSADFSPDCSVIGFVSANAYSYKNVSRLPLFESLRIKKIIFASNVGTSSCP
ncbi:MAG: hypothetical protein WC848_03820 [Parcubacteria group bacterium]|jgi:hypothetical protein